MMNQLLVKFYNEELRKLDVLLEHPENREFLKHYMEYVKKLSVQNIRSEEEKKLLLETAFDNKDLSFRMFFGCKGEITIPKSLRDIFCEKKGYVNYYYESKMVYQKKLKVLQNSFKTVSDYQKCFNYLGMDVYVRDLLCVIQDEMHKLTNLPKEDVEVMQIVCGKGKDKVTYDLYSKRIDLPEKDLLGHIRLVDDEEKTLFSTIKNDSLNNMKRFYSNNELKDIFCQYAEIYEYVKKNPKDTLSLVKQ